MAYKDILSQVTKEDIETARREILGKHELPEGDLRIEQGIVNLAYSLAEARLRGEHQAEYVEEEIERRERYFLEQTKKRGLRVEDLSEDSQNKSELLEDLLGTPRLRGDTRLISQLPETQSGKVKLGRVFKKNYDRLKDRY